MSLDSQACVGAGQVTVRGGGKKIQKLRIRLDAFATVQALRLCERGRESGSGPAKCKCET